MLKSVVLAFLASIAVARALTSLPGFSDQPIGGGWVEPVGVAFDQTNDNRMYVWERGGRVWIVEDGVKLAPPLIDLSDEVGAWRDYGMLGLALDPRFCENGHIYLSYVVDRHHLLHAGTPAYDPAANEYFAPTIGRIVRYTANVADGFRSVDPASRRVLLGETIATGFPIIGQTHGTGHLGFGADGTLLASCGESAGFERVDDGSDPTLSDSVQALADGILQPKENVGAFRAQLVDSVSGKIVRLDPATGDGVSGNPFFDPAAPRAARSRVWTLGLRNPYRFTMWPGTGGANAPGVIVLGDVGWGAYEEIDVIDGPAQNCGWPIFEGLTTHESYRILPIANLDAPNPLGGFFSFRDLLTQETLAPASWPNPLDPSQEVPSDIPRFMHRRPVIDIGHDLGEVGPARVGIFNDTTAAHVRIGAPGSPVAGPQFGANASTGGVFYTGSDFPALFAGAYFHADYGHGWIKAIKFGADRHPVEVRDFASGGAPVFVATHPTLGALYVVDSSDATVRKITFSPDGNRPPVAVASADVEIGGSPLIVAFSSAGSLDPDGLPIQVSWDFADGSTSSDPSPTHVFSAASATRFDVRLTVTDTSGASAQAIVPIFVNHTLPEVTLLSPIDGTKYSLSGATAYALTRRVLEVPGHPTVTQWNIYLHHNDHIHPEPPIIAPSATTIISPTHSDTDTYYFRVVLTVTDNLGAVVRREARLLPNLENAAPMLSWSAPSVRVTADGTPQILDSSATVADVDSPGLEFGRLRIALAGGMTGDVLSIVPDALVTLDADEVAVGGVVVGAVSGGSSGAPLAITFNEAATPAAVRAILRRAVGAFSSRGSRSITATVDDGDGGIGTTGTLAIDAVPPSNQRPVIALTTPGDGATFSAPASLALAATASDADGAISKVEFFAGAARIGKVNAPPWIWKWSGMSPGAYALTARATDNSGASTTSGIVNVTVPGASGPPAPWLAQDIGAVAVIGRTFAKADGLTIRASGRGFGTGSDALHFAWQSWAGDGEIVARIDSLHGVTSDSFGGLAFRESLLPGSRHVSLTLHTSGEVALRWRGGATSGPGRIEAPSWLKLKRGGDRFIAQVSRDGATWTRVGAASVALPQQLFVGLAASSASGTTARAVVAFSQVAGPRAP